MYGQRRQVGGADRSRRAHSRVCRARVSPARCRAGPGPVVLALARGHAERRADVADAPYVDALPHRPVRADDIASSRRGCALREHRSCIVGGSAGMMRRGRALAPSRRRWQLPVACAFRHQDLFDNRHPNYAGDVGIGINPKLGARVRDARYVARHRRAARRDDDVGYTLLDVPVPRRR